MVHVTWHDAVAFCAWLSKKEAATYRLPTEGEAVPANTGMNARSRSIAYATGAAWYPADFVVTWGAAPGLAPAALTPSIERFAREVVPAVRARLGAH